MGLSNQVNRVRVHLGSKSFHKNGVLPGCLRVAWIKIYFDEALQHKINLKAFKNKFLWSSKMVYVYEKVRSDKLYGSNSLSTKRLQTLYSATCI